MLAFGVLVGFHARPSWAGNLDAFYLSGDSAMQAGAITADARGGGSVWYNPAGLAELDGLRLDVSVNGYAVRFGGNADIDAPPGTDIVRLTSLDLNVVPTALTLTQRVGRVGLGFGLFVPTQSTSILRTQIKTLEDDAGSSIQFSYDAYRRYQEYHAGPSIGFFISDDVKLGASFLVNYRSLVDMNTATVALAAGDQSAAVTSHSLLDSVQVGAEAVLGLQWRIARNWNFGFVARTPAVRLYQLVQTMDTTTTTGQTPTLDAKEVSGLETTVLTPFRFHSGLSYAFDSSRVALEGNLQLPYADTKAGTDTRLTWNVRAGMRTALSPTLSFGGGLFTDQSPAPDLKEFGDSRINYYGATIAMDMGTPYGIYAKDGKTFERPRSLVFGTTVALSYALGLGMVNRAELSPTNPDLVRINPTDVTAHEITLHIGSTLAE